MLKTFWSKFNDFITLKKFLAIFFCMFFFVYVLFAHFIKNFDDQINLKLNFKFRELLGTGPELDPRLKFVIFNDTSIQKLKTKEPTFALWTEFFEKANRTPNIKIMIDKVFGLLTQDEEFAKLKLQLSQMKSPVIVSAIASPFPKKVADDTSLQTDYIKKLHKNLWSASSDTKIELDGKPWHYYGPDNSIIHSFANNGHVFYKQNGRISPYFFFSKDHILPHISMFAVDDTKFTKTRAIIPGREPAPLDKNNETIINIVSVGKLRPTNRTFNFEDVILHDKKTPMNWLKENDVLVVLPYMYSGGTDWVETPLGKIPGGQVIVSTINSALTGQWIRAWEYKWLVALVFSLASSIAAIVLGPLFFSICFIGLNALLVFSGLTLFAFYSINFDWFTVCAAVNFTSIASFLAKMRSFEKRAMSLKISLGASLPHMKLKSFLGNPNDLVLEPCMKVVTVMFIDIEGFSGISDTLSPKECFLNLQRVFSRIAQTVHDHGGVVDKSLGDGMLIFFGYYYDGRESYADHADAAVRCAVQIQREVLELSSLSVTENRPIFPLRIGINSGSVYFGNLGDTRRIDINIIGAGVNFAQRLEAACEAFRILVSNTTRELASCLHNNQFVSTQRLIPVKHQEEPISVYEIEPIPSNSEELKVVTNKHREIMKLQRHEERWPISENCQIKLTTSDGTGRVIDISHSGMLIELDQYYGRNLSFSAELLCTNAHVQKRLADLNLVKVTLQCRWGRRAANKRYYHGVKFTNLDKDQRTQFMNVIADSLHDANKLLEVNG